MSKLSAKELYAQTYDEAVPDWPGEIDFYRELAARLTSGGGSLLEVACGTGRVATRLAHVGVKVVGIDLSAEMLAVARKKSAALENLRWVQADMRNFELGEQFDLAIIPGHAFQNLNTPQDQLNCLECIQRHLIPGGTLVVHLDHQDVGWLGGLVSGNGGVFDAAGQVHHPQSGRLVRKFQAWTYEPASQSAFSQVAWEEIDENGKVVERWQADPVRLHCVFRFEMEHLLGRAGYVIEAVWGDFFRNRLEDRSENMVWVARKKGGSNE
jgi:ubiquinone/menaquinone biosynthesis C-methylase UbiE